MRIGLAAFVKGHDHHGSSIAMNQCGLLEKFGFSPSFRLMLLTTGLPWIFFNPISRISHFELSTIIGTFEISGSDATRSQKLLHGSLGVEHAFVHIDVDDLGSSLDLLSRD